MLFLVEKQGVLTQAELTARARQALDFSGNPALRELGLSQQPYAGEMIEHSLADLFERGWLVGDAQLSITDEGRDHLRQQTRRTRREAHRVRRRA